MKNFTNIKRIAFTKAILATALLSIAVPASAQLEEIVVTATKRAKSLQDVAVSVVAMSGETVKEFGIGRGEEFAADIPAITIAQNPISNFIFVRGVGTAGSNAGIEQSVSMFHDGIYMGRHQLSRSPFMDLDRVEVLRGPQGILFGKNTIGGAIHVIAAKPTDEFEGSVGVLLGEDGEQELSGVLSGPFSDSLRGRLSYRSYEYDGFLKNVMLDGRKAPERDDATIRAQLEWDISDTLTAHLKYENNTYEQFQITQQMVTVNPFTPGAAAVSGLNQALVAAATGGDGVLRLDEERAVDNDGGRLLGQVVPAFAGLPGFPDLLGSSDNESNVTSLSLDWQLGDHTITSITGYAEYDFRDTCDCDFSALPLIEVDATENYEQVSQEIRITSPAGETIEYIAGLYYQDSDLDYRSIEGFGTVLLTAPGLSPILFPNLTRDYRFLQESEAKAVFGSLTWNFRDTTRATFGLRYSEESKQVNHRLDKQFTSGWDFSSLAGLPAGTLSFGASPAEYDRFLATPGLEAAAGLADGVIFSGSLGTFEHDITRARDEDFVTWSIGMQHDFSDLVMGYANIATGVKGGGFDARFLRTNTSPFFEYEEEKALSYELGMKSTLLDGNLTLNGALFLTTVEDYQVSIFDGATAFFVQNAAEVESKGLELDLKWLASDNLLVSFAGSYLDASYAEFRNAPCWAGTLANNRGDCIDRGTPMARRDATGDANIFSPEFSFNLKLDYNVPISDNLEVRAGANINYSDDHFTAADLDVDYAAQDSFTKVDLRLALGSIDGKWDIAILGKNLTNEFTSGNNNDQPLVPGNGFSSTDRLRSVAIQANYRF